MDEIRSLQGDAGLRAVVLAAGLGTRMRSSRPKVLHEILGESLISHVLTNLREAGVGPVCVVTGHGAQEVEAEALRACPEAVFHRQTRMLGTADALSCAAAFFAGEPGRVLVVCGDAPMLMPGELTRFIGSSASDGCDMAVLSARLEQPGSYGRVLRDAHGVFTCIREASDASPEELLVNEINSGAYIFDSRKLALILPSISNANSKGEYYLTDVAEAFLAAGHRVSAFEAHDPGCVLAVNDRSQLAECAQAMKRIVNARLMASGVTVADPEATYIGRRVAVGPDTEIYPGTWITGDTVIGGGCEIRASRISNCVIGDGCLIEESVMEDAEVSGHCSVGPFARLRPGSVIGPDCRIGNFVEIKNSSVGAGVKAAHLTYIGDADVGDRVNFGCGTVTANYDGVNKHRTSIGEGAFIGCNVNLIAPVKIGRDAFLGAGSTITRDVAAGALAVERAGTLIRPDYARGKKPPSQDTDRPEISPKPQ